MPVINEIRIDQPSDDNDEYFELFGTAGESLDGLSYIVIGDGTGGSGVVESVTNLSGLSLDANGFFVAAESTFTLGTADLTATLDFENSDNVTHLLVRDFTGSIGDDLDTDDDGVLDVVPWTEIVDGVALIESVGSGDQVYSSTQVGPDGSFVPGHVFRDTDGTGSFVIGAFDPVGGDDTPGGDMGGGGGPIAATIMEIQGAGHTSPLVGMAVMTTGIVTAVDSNGFYLQDATGDGDIATSDAVFVFTGSSPTVSVGDALEVEGSVSEFFPGGSGSGNLSTTQISGNPTITTISTGNDLPDAQIIGADGRLPPTETIDDDGLSSFDPETDGIDFFESLEGMRVTATDLQVVAGTNRFGEIFAVVDGGAGATGLSDRGTLNISPDDFNPEKIQIDEDSGIFDFLFPDVSVGDVIGDVTGVVGYSFGNFEILPTEDFTSQIVSGDLEPETTSISGSLDELTVATYNVLNLDPVVEDVTLVDDQDPNDVDDDEGDGRFAEIAQQIVDGLASPDIIGLQEIQDNTGAEIGDGVTSASETLQKLVDAIVDAGGPEYEFIDNTFITEGASGGQPGGNIRTAFLYNPDRVDLVEGSVEAVGSQAPGETFDGARLPLSATFTFNGEEVTLVNNHLSSKGGSAPILGVEQPFEELQEDPNVNGSLDERREQAQAVNDYVDGLLAEDPDANVIVLGDMNEFEFVSPLAILAGTEVSIDMGENTAPGGEAILTNLLELLPEDERYTFIFQGNSQALDHILATDGLLEGAEIDIVHVNSEFAATESRGSDHDPVLASFLIEAPSTDVAVDFSPIEVLGGGRLPGALIAQSIDGEVVDLKVAQSPVDRANFRDAGVVMKAVDPDDPEVLNFRTGAVGIKSSDDEGYERRAVDGDEFLRFELDTVNFGQGVEAEFEFARVRGTGDVLVEFFDDGDVVGVMSATVDRGDVLQLSLDGVEFDQVELSAVGDTAFTLDGFEFRLLDDPLAIA